ncbi:MAG: PAS domain S-box-containing protein [Bacteroidia bacterium]|jgi:PAS domain S-box-containing protein
MEYQKEDLLAEIERLKKSLEEKNAGNLEQAVSKERTAFPSLDEAESDRQRKKHDLHFQIATLVEKDDALPVFFREVHAVLNKFISIESLLVAVKNDPTKQIDIPFYVNSENLETDGIHGEAFARIAIRLRRSRVYLEEKLQEIAPKHRILPTEVFPKTWLAIPFLVKKSAIGALIIQSFSEENEYSESDLDLLDFVSGQLTSAVLRKINEQEVSSQSARLEAIFEGGKHLMWSINSLGEFTKFNQNFANTIWEHYQVFPVEFMPFEKIGNKRKYDFYTEWENAYENAFKGDSQQFEINFPNENGAEQWFEIFLNPIHCSDSKKVLEVAGVASNTTQKKATDLFLKEREEKFRNIFNSFQDVYFRTDMEGIINMVSPSVFELVGEGHSDVMGKSVTDYYISQSKMENLRNVLLKEGSVKNFESTLTDKSRKKKSIISNFRLIEDTNGNPQYIEGVARDISDLRNATKKLEEAMSVAEKSLAIRKQFVSNMSHEIRTPMNGIIGMIDLLNETTDLDEEQQEYVSTVKKSSETLLNILNDILDLSKIEAGKMKLRNQPVHLPNLIEKLKALFTHQAKAKNTELTCRLQKGLPEYVMADETRLLQILSNLTSNAIKFTDYGQVKLSAENLFFDADKYVLKFSVEDTGIGISQENLDLLFRQFSQVDSSYTKSFGGTGLGLAISQELSKIMGGEVGVHSEKYKGSTFWFTIQAKICTRKDIAEAEKLEQEPGSFELSVPHKILVVDDNAVNLQVASTILKKAGCEVIQAQSGPVAIELVQKEEFEVIFMDIQMPNMNGMSATKRIRRKLGKRTPPIVAMTAFSLQEEREEFLAAGMDDYISKPIKARNLIAMAKKWTEGKDSNSIELAEKSVKEKQPAESAHHLLNIETANQLAKYGGNELLSSVYGDFESEMFDLLNKGEKAIELDDLAEALSILHTIKGNAGTLGAEQISAQSTLIETKLKQKNWDNVNVDFQKLQADFENFKSHYKQLLNLSE